MKTIARLASLAAVATLLAGCATAKKPMPAPMPTRSPAETLERVKAQVGSGVFASVTEVDDADGWVALGEATPGDFPVNAVASIVDESGTTVGFATIKQSEPGKIYGTYSKKDGGRAARVGDVAVKF